MESCALGQYFHRNINAIPNFPLVAMYIGRMT